MFFLNGPRSSHGNLNKYHWPMESLADGGRNKGLNCDHGINGQEGGD